jgi:hypothetical protein
MSEHLDLDALADVLAGEASPDHLGGCALCQAALVELEASLSPVATTLAGLVVPDPPSDLPARLEAALAKERRAAESAHGATTVTPLARLREQRTRWLPGAGAVAAAAALVVGGVVVVQQLGGSGDANGDKNTSALGAQDRFTTSSTGNDYSKDGVELRRALPQLLSGQAGQADEAAKTAESNPLTTTTTTVPKGSVDPLAALREPTALASCLASLSESSDPGLPLALDYASLAKQPALVVVLPSSKADKVDVFVVGAGCSQADAQVLFFTRLDKP